MTTIGQRLRRTAFSTLLADMSEAVLYADEQRTILLTNKAASLITQYSRTELRRLTLDSLLGRDSAIAIFDAAVAKDQPVHIPELTTIRRSDGTEAFVQGVARLVSVVGDAPVVRLVLRDMTHEQTLQSELQVSLQDRRQAHEIERLRLSRKLHEEVLQDVLALAISLESLPKTADGQLTKSKVSELATQTRDIAHNLRNVSHALRPRILDRMSLVSALRTIVRESDTNSLKSRLYVRGHRVQMPWYVESGIYRIVLELLSNVRKHAKASQVRTTLVFRKRDIALTVEDNGVGFVYQHDLSDLIAEGKHGIVGLHERVEYLGGLLSIESLIGKGTKIRIVVPYESAHARRYSHKVWPNVPDYLPPK